MTTVEIYWLAGLLEGEGCFCFSKTARLYFGSTDEDVINRVAKLLKSNVLKHPGSSKESKLYYQTVKSGTYAIGLMMTLYSILGERRQRAIRGVIEEWRAM